LFIQQTFEKGAVRSLANCRYGGEDANSRRVMAIGWSDQTVMLINEADALEGIDFPQAREQVGSEVAASPEGTYLATGHRNGVIRLWDLSGGKPALLSAKEQIAKQDAGWLQGVWQEEPAAGLGDSMVFWEDRFELYESRREPIVG